MNPKHQTTPSSPGQARVPEGMVGTDRTATTRAAGQTREGAQEGKKEGNEEKEGETRTVIQGDRAPRLPHERDESASSQDSPSREVIEQAASDVERGLKDGDLGPPMDELYERRFRDGGKPQRP